MFTGENLSKSSAHSFKKLSGSWFVPSTGRLIIARSSFTAFNKTPSSAFTSVLCRRHSLMPLSLTVIRLLSEKIKIFPFSPQLSASVSKRAVKIRLFISKTPHWIGVSRYIHAWFIVYCNKRFAKHNFFKLRKVLCAFFAPQTAFLNMQPQSG